jgi:cell division protease FtsH
VERILREQEDRATKMLRRHRKGLDLVAVALLEKETIDGAEVARLVDQAFGRAVHGGRDATVPRFGSTEPADAGPLDEDETVEMDRSRFNRP